MASFIKCTAAFSFHATSSSGLYQALSSPTRYHHIKSQFFNSFVVPQQVRRIHKTSMLQLNRFLFEQSELDEPIEDGGGDTIPTVTLTKNDYRTIHAARTLGLKNGDTLRAGIVRTNQIPGGFLTDQDVDPHPHAGNVTDQATIEWFPEGKIKKAEPTARGEPPGSLRVTLHSLASSYRVFENAAHEEEILPVSLILALPRPLALGRLLPMIAQLGVEHLVLTSAKKVPKDYFGSHLFRKPHELEKLLVEGLCQAGDTQLPHVSVVKHLKSFVNGDLDTLFPPEEYARVIAHPQRYNDDNPPLRMSNVVFPKSSTSRKIVLAVGPEGGWTEDNDLDMFRDQGFQQISLGTRILRSDVAVVSLLSLAHATCATSEHPPAAS
jgi:RsmE family RNA methyltransferase